MQGQHSAITYFFTDLDSHPSWEKGVCKTKKPGKEERTQISFHDNILVIWTDVSDTRNWL
jgi:hypothetical protein